MNLIISAFPGVGKTRLHQEAPDRVHDSDSSTFSWVAAGVRNPDFPVNYIRHIADLSGLVLVSSHDVVRDALAAHGLQFWLCYPARECKGEYLERYRRRGSPESFIALLDAKWDEWLAGLEADERCYGRIVLGPGRYLSDVDLARRFGLQTSAHGSGFVPDQPVCDLTLEKGTQQAAEFETRADTVGGAARLVEARELIVT